MPLRIRKKKGDPTIRKYQKLPDPPPRSNREKYDAYWRECNRLRLRNYQREYMRKKRDEMNAIAPGSVAKNTREYRKKNRSLYRKIDRDYRRSERGKVSVRSYKDKNRDAIRRRGREYNQKNKPKINAQRRVRYKMDIQYAISCRLRKRGQLALKKAMANKSYRWFTSLGCSKEKFLIHIASQFTNGMTWDNRTEWELDHIFPLKAFDLKRPDHQAVAFHYLNIQPLWRVMNNSKSSLIPKIIPSHLAAILRPLKLIL